MVAPPTPSKQDGGTTCLRFVSLRSKTILPSPPTYGKMDSIHHRKLNGAQWEHANQCSQKETVAFAYSRKLPLWKTETATQIHWMLEASSIVDVTIAISTLYCSVKKGLRAGDIFQILFLAPLARGKSGTAATSGESASVTPCWGGDQSKSSIQGSSWNFLIYNSRPNRLRELCDVLCINSLGFIIVCLYVCIYVCMS